MKIAFVQGTGSPIKTGIKLIRPQAAQAHCVKILELLLYYQ